MCHLSNKDRKVGDKRMFNIRFDKLYKDVDSASKALSTLDKLFGAKAHQVKSSRFLRKYNNPDLFYLDKSAGILPINSYIDNTGKVYQVEY